MNPTSITARQIAFFTIGSLANRPIFQSSPLPAIRAILLYNHFVNVYRRETKDIITRFCHHRLSFPACISALDAALARFLPRLTGDQILALRALMLANNETVMKEMERRGDPKENSTENSGVLLFRPLPGP